MNLSYNDEPSSISLLQSNCDTLERHHAHGRLSGRQYFGGPSALQVGNHFLDVTGDHPRYNQQPLTKSSAIELLLKNQLVPPQSQLEQM